MSSENSREISASLISNIAMSLYDRVNITYFIVHLFRAVEDIDHDAQSSTQVFGCLCLSGPGWSGRCSTHSQVEGLGESDVAAVSQRCDN